VGVLVYGPYLANEVTADFQSKPSIIVADHGFFVMFWETILSGSKEVAMRMFVDDASPFSLEARINNITTGTQ